MKFVSLAIKILPLCTLVYGLMSGGTRMGPFIDTAQVALTQYEIGEISRLVHAHLEDQQKPPEKNFSDFVRERFHSQYSVLAREIKGQRSHDHGTDIWGRDYKLVYDREGQDVKIFSAGPDGTFDSPDDIVAHISYDDGSSRRTVKKKMIVEPERSPASVEEVQTENTETDEYGNPYAREDANQEAQPMAHAEEPVDNREPAAEETHHEEPQVDEGQPMTDEAPETY